MDLFGLRFLLITFLASFFVVACTTQPEIPDLTPNFSAVIVNDMDISILWYQEKLGFEVVDKVDNEERGFRQANLSRDMNRLELIQLDTAIKASELLDQHGPRARLTGFLKIGYSVSDFDTWTAHLNENQADINGRIVSDPDSGKRMAVYLDPDGNRIQIFEK
jgi:catechol 2,3-dioxygenase-like lactoylglutathione lyase family enzyme